MISMNQWMQKALTLAKEAIQNDEVPVAALLVMNEEMIASASNAVIQQCSPLAHAEMLVIQQASKELGYYKLRGTTLYVTLEPCLMCLGAVIQAQISRVVFGAYDTSGGAISNQLNVPTHSLL